MTQGSLEKHRATEAVEWKTWITINKVKAFHRLVRLSDELMIF
jgi:hypothetical protein